MPDSKKVERISWPNALFSAVVSFMLSCLLAANLVNFASQQKMEEN